MLHQVIDSSCCILLLSDSGYTVVLFATVSFTSLKEMNNGNENPLSRLHQLLSFKSRRRDSFDFNNLYNNRQNCNIDMSTSHPQDTVCGLSESVTWGSPASSFYDYIHDSSSAASSEVSDFPMYGSQKSTLDDTDISTPIPLLVLPSPEQRSVLQNHLSEAMSCLIIEVIFDS